MSKHTPFSLLWPDGSPTPGTKPWQTTTATDLGLEHLINALNVDGRHERDMKAIVLTACNDADTIYYRQEVIEDLLSMPNVLEQFKAALPMLNDLTYYSTSSDAEALPFQRTLARLGELELYIRIVRTFSALLNDIGGGLMSRGLCALRDMLLERATDPLFEQMERELPNIAAKVSKLASITIGVNLDHNLKPIGATIVSVNTEPFQGSSFFKKLFGDRPAFQGETPLHTVPMQNVNTLDGRIVSTQMRSDPMLVPLFRDLDRLINHTIRPVAAALTEFLNISTQFLAALEPEIVFYLGATRLILDLTERGLSMCRAEVADPEARTCVIRDCYNLNLALRSMQRQAKADLSDQVIANDVAFDEEGRIFIITGPNRGGKTTYIQGLALAQILFQAGLYVPGTHACISPVDAIYTHFPVEEKPSAEAGRFGEEAQRLSDIFAHATRHSLILLNESLASTAPGESLYLARDILRCFRLLGVRAAFTTHMHELAANLDEVNDTTPGDSKAVSLIAVAQTDSSSSDNGDVRRTYKIIASPPMGRSYAHELAARYGISFDKIVETLSERGAIDPAAVQTTTA